MLVLSRRCGEEIVIGGDIRLTVLSVKGERVRLGIAAPDTVSVDRLEVRERRFSQADHLVPAEAGTVLPDLMAIAVHQ